MIRSNSRVLVLSLVCFSFALSFFCLFSGVFSGQTQAQQIEPLPQATPPLVEPLTNEIRPEKIKPEFLRKWDLSGTAVPNAPEVTKLVRVVYLVPSDKSSRSDYQTATGSAFQSLQSFYQTQMGSGYHFLLNSPVTQTVQLPHTSAWYSTNPSGGSQDIWFWSNVLSDAFSATGGGFNDPNNRWIYYIDADPGCGQSIGGTSGVALMAANDLRGLTGQQNVPNCPGGSPDTFGLGRWIGGAGHELGHAFNLPHPPGCGGSGANYGCTGGAYAANSLMWVGYAYYPDTYLLPENIQALYATGFFVTNPTIQFSSPTYSVDESGVYATINVIRSSSDGVATFNYSTSNGTATAGSDYEAAPAGSLMNFDFGMTTAQISVRIYDDNFVEGDETVNLTLSNPSSGYSLGTRSTAVLTIRDNDVVGPRRSPFDFEGDGKTDVGIFRPNGVIGAEWWVSRSSDGGVLAATFGASTDIPTPGDFTGDGKTDIAVFRPSNGFWYILKSEDSLFYGFPFGNSADNIPAPADYDGDKKTDAAVFVKGAWYILRSSDGGVTSLVFGIAGDKPVPADYDGDGKADIAIYRPNGTTGGEWWVLKSGGGILSASFGNSTDKAVVGDYTGDGKADCAFFRPSTGTWYILRSEDMLYYGFPFGNSTDSPAPGDYDGDGKMDAAVFRQPNEWYVNKSSGGVMSATWGSAGDLPVPGSYVP